MKISFLKYKNDVDVYSIPKNLGMDIFEIENPYEVDKKIEELKSKNYKTIFLPSTLAGFSEKMFNKYQKDKDLKIIITPTKKG